ncbi:unnamed protein product [Diatraea saccharalis]|uniref:Ankyrin repeat domain-containing protein 6 n=1 Tax=Diatraea saccharalis TaxID=40085 RepID=A0A9N9R2Y0_9NEOP|nr:unnamed protein product [Diatraea saccharalis]
MVPPADTSPMGWAGPHWSVHNAAFDGVSARMSGGAALLEAAARGDAPRLVAALQADPRLIHITDEEPAAAMIVAEQVVETGPLDVARFMCPFTKVRIVCLCWALALVTPQWTISHLTLTPDVMRTTPFALEQNGCTALQRAAADGHVEAVRLLLQHGADPNKQDHLHGNTALHEAAWKGYSRCVALLAGGGAELRARNGGGSAALHLACQNGHNQSCRELLLAGAPPHLQNNYGDTPLHTAARYGHAGVTRILISAQCRVSEQNKNGDTALHIAAAMGRRKLTRILLEAGCDKAIKNQQGETARDIATRKGLEEIINILNTPVAKQPKKKEKRDKSKDRGIDEPDDGKKKNKDKKKKNVHFEQQPPPVQWSPYGCHYYPDPKYFPKPKLSSLPTEPLKKGEQYYLDLAGNIKKGPIGAGYTCYCAPFFKHMEDKLNEDKKDLKRHIDRAHERLDQKVTDLEMKTQGQISELTRFVAAERAMCNERHKHLEHWLTRGMMFRASERIRKLDFSPKGSLDIPPLKRTRSLEILDTHTEEWNKVNRLIKTFNKNSEQYESNAKDLNETRVTSKSTEVLDSRRSPPTPRRKYILKNSRSTDQLEAGPSTDLRFSRSPNAAPCHASSKRDSHLQNVTAEIHVKANKICVSQSPLSMEVQDNSERYVSPNLTPHVISPNGSNRHSDYKANDSDGENLIRTQIECPQDIPVWKSQVLQRTADDIRKRVMLDKEMSDVIGRTNSKSLDIAQDGYVKLRKQGSCPREESSIVREPRKSVQELVAQVEHHQQGCKSPEPLPLQRKMSPSSVHEEPIALVQPCPGILKMPQQPQRPAPVLKEKPPKSKRFSLHNLIPFPTRKTFQTPPKDNGNNSESSDEEDNPIRTTNQPGPMRNTNLLQTLPMPNFETMSNKSPSPAPQVQHQNNPYPHDLRTAIPKDAYFHDISNRQIPHQTPYREIIENGLPVPQYNTHQTNRYDYNETGLPHAPVQGRNRNPLYYHQRGVFDAMMQDHILREMERIPQCYGDHLDQNTEIEISNQNDQFRGSHYGNRSPMYPNFRGNPHGVRKAADHNLLHTRLQSLAINTHLTETQSQTDRESHNDSGYSTKVYGSSQGPSPSLSGHVECSVSDNLSGQRVDVVPGGKIAPQIGASSLV